MDALHEMHIDFHEFGAQFRPQAQTRKAFAQIIYRDLEAHATVVQQRTAHALEIEGGLILGDFDDDPFWVYAEISKVAQRLPVFETGVR